jgi:transposase
MRFIMNGFELTAKEIQELKLAHRTVKEKRAADRIKTIYLLGTGWTQKEVCEALLLDESTLRHYVKRYKEGGIKKLVSNHYLGGEAKLSAEELGQLDEHLQETLYLNAKSIVTYIEKTFNVSYGVRGVTELLKRLGFVYKKPKIIPGKSNPEAQKEFLEAYKSLKDQLKCDDKILFMDGIHPQHNTVSAYGWIKKGSIKEIKSNTGRQRLNINGALELGTCRVTVTLEETLNAITILSLLKKIRRVYRNAGKIYIICDNASYYKSENTRLVAAALNIELVFLPPYSPNLNLIERLWKFFRKKVMNNKYYEKFSDFKFAVDIFFNKEIKKYTSELRSLLTENFQIIGQT